MKMKFTELQIKFSTVKCQSQNKLENFTSYSSAEVQPEKSTAHKILKELRNYNRKLFLCPQKKQKKTQPTF